MNSKQRSEQESNRGAVACGPFRVGMVLSHCHPDVTGGTEWQARLLARCLARRGHQVVVFARNPLNSKPAAEELDGFSIVRIRSLVIAGSARGGGFGCPILIRRYASAIRAERERFDVLHSHLASFPTAGAAVASWLTGARLVLKLACSGPAGDLETLHSLGLRAHGPLIRRLVARADRVVAITDALAREARAFGFPPERIVRIPNGVELQPEKLGLASGAGGPRRRIDHGAGATVVGVGRLNRQKRFDLLIEAAAKLRVAFPALRTRIFGEGPEREMLSGLIKKCDLDSCVQMLGRQPPETIYPAADIFVLPSDYEGMSNALLEAMAWGRPCIVSDIPANREAAQGAALFFRPGDAAALAEALVQYLREPDEAARYGELARARAAGSFDIEAVASRYEELYASLTAGGRGR